MTDHADLVNRLSLSDCARCREAADVIISLRVQLAVADTLRTLLHQMDGDIIDGDVYDAVLAAYDEARRD